MFDALPVAAEGDERLDGRGLRLHAVRHAVDGITLEQLAFASGVVIEPGDEIQIRTANGGGWGDPDSARA